MPVFSKHTGSRHLALAQSKLDLGDNITIYLGDVEGILVVLDGKIQILSDQKTELTSTSAVLITKHLNLKIVSLTHNTSLILVCSLSGIALVA